MMEGLTFNPAVTTIDSIMVPVAEAAAALLENAAKRRRIEAPTTEGGVVEVVMESPITMVTSSLATPSAPATQSSFNGGSSPKQGPGIPTNGFKDQTRFTPFDSSKTEQIALLTALSQVVSCTQEAVKILRDSQERSLDLEHKRFRFQLEAEEKRLMMESEHYRKMETMFSGLIQAISQTPHTTSSTSEGQKETRKSPANVKLEVDT